MEKDSNTKQFDVGGMTCSACAAHVEKAVNAIDGAKCTVNLLLNRMEVQTDGSVDAAKIISAVEKAGYTAVPRGETTGEPPQIKKSNRTLIGLWTSVGFLAVLMYVSMGHMFSFPMPHFMHGTKNAMTFALTQALLLIPIVAINIKYFSRGFKALVHLRPNMDSLIAVGSGAAILYGIAALYGIGYGLGHGDFALVERLGMDLYFESAGTILTLISVGKYLEERSKGKTGEAVKKLLDLSPKTAVLITPDGEKEVPSAQLKAGDTVLVRPGSAVPADGTVISGAASVDESAITGESVPVEKSEGSTAICATVVKSGVMTVRVDRVGEDTTLSQIVKLVEQAGGSKAPIARLADKVSLFFVPAVMGIALIALVGWLIAGYGIQFSLSIAIAVLVISCPCALGLATPTAIMVGTGRGARMGVLYKSAQALETAHKVTAVVLDKTGTVTLGRPSVTDFTVIDGDEDELVSIIAAAERMSEHPLAQAVVAYAQSRGAARAECSGFAMTEGGGITAKVRGKSVAVGNARLMKKQGVEIDGDITARAESAADEGKTVLYCAVDGCIAALVALMDTVREDSRAAIAELRRMKIKVTMLTGDNERTARAVAHSLGDIEYRAEVMPSDKERAVSALRSEGHTVAMIGDGINDAPALAAADVGCAIGAGTDIAIEAADVVLMKSGLTDAVNALRLSKSVLRNIKQNLFWAFFYNAICIPVAAGAFVWAGLRLSPMIAAAAMSLSSVCVVLNALRLRFFKPISLTAAADAVPAGSAAKSNLVAAKTEQVDNEINNNKKEISKKGENKMNTVTVKIGGMTCGHCSARVEKAIAELGYTVRVDLSAGTAAIEGSVVDLAAVQSAVESAGYEFLGAAQ